MYKIQSSHPQLIEFSIPETIRIIGTKPSAQRFLGCLGGQALLVIG